MNSSREIPPMVVIADDLSGAMDTGVQFARAGLTTLLILDKSAHMEGEVLIFNTESRSSSAEEASKRVVDVVQVLCTRNIFKKIDSTLRGHITQEVITLLSQLGQSSAVVCPAIPDQGRRVRDGILWVNGKKLHETGFASDPTWPSHTSDVLTVLGGNGKHIPIEIVRSDKLLDALRSSHGTFLVPDAWDEWDLQYIADATVAAGLVPCGAAGFAHAWLQTMLGRSTGESFLTWGGTDDPILFIIGSFHPQARRQIKQATIRVGFPCYEITRDDTKSLEDLKAQVRKALWEQRGAILCSPHTPIQEFTTRLSIQAQLADIAHGCVTDGEVGVLVLSGGDTAQAVLTRLEPDGVHICDELVSGVPYGILSGGCKPDLPVVTKAGSWGDDQILIELIHKLQIGLV